MSEGKQAIIYYLGEKYPLAIVEDTEIKKVIIELRNNAMICRSPSIEDIDYLKALKSFYTKEGKKLINQRLKIYQPLFKEKYKQVTIEDSLTKCGSCSSKKNLMFNWNLMIFPIEVIDYVVVHELCHLIHMNHDRSFWRLLGKHYPNYKEAMAILGTEKTRDI